MRGGWRRRGGERGGGAGRRRCMEGGGGVWRGRRPRVRARARGDVSCADGLRGTQIKLSCCYVTARKQEMLNNEERSAGSVRTCTQKCLCTFQSAAFEVTGYI